ncbi:rhodanese-like domain-containing protein [Neptunomonas antarctica]|uniref:Rhodanese-like domain-containing protein n=1 Tax=Neptunomonas antarctica TaxID=619304 RepID=A0A1N7IX18_9GAMM|nr:rhodanese-like domain-containing protein [Neptunomonas antarctica]SIS41630.1 Rhodanese-like domain-containing protein [Neptunomonas antarctica]
MNKLLKHVLLIAALAIPVYSANAADIGISAQDTQALIQKNENVLFLDVRDPIEIMFIGFTDAVDINIPYLMVDRSQWDDKKKRFRLYQNPDFIAQVKAALTAKGLGDDATIITMCRSGSERGLPSAEFLKKNGFKNARYVVHGFQGDSLKEGEKSGFRIKNGWQNEGLLWGAKPNPEKIYRTDR